jgi:putative ATPase
MEAALSGDESLSKMNLEISNETLEALVRFSAGDARHALNALELAGQITPVTDGKRILSPPMIEEAVQRQLLRYDKKGDFHYDIISAFIKSLRGSDPDAAVYWLARMIDAGEDPLFIARRMVILASEDVGNADPLAMVVASSAFQSVHAVGMPEASLILAQAATYLASAPKSNASTEAIVAALEDARTTGHEAVPLHLRNAPTSLMKAMGHGSGYKYAHDFKGGFVDQEFLPAKLKDRVYYRPKDIGTETRIKERLEKWWPKKKREAPSKNHP